LTQGGVRISLAMMKHAVITGASQGLGREMALYFAGRGWKVSGCGRNEARVSSLASELGSDHSVEAVDVRDDSQVAAWAASVLNNNGVPDLVLNNAAVMARLAPVWELSAAEISQIMEINVEGTIHVIRHFLPAMIEKGSGVVVNFSSGWGRSTSPEVAAYCTSKWAIEGLTSALAQELPHGMAAVALNPGIIATEMLRSCWGGAADSYPSAKEWIHAAGPFLEKLGARDNGRQLTVPGAATD
jgi:NAD(P)-dependent dehydrogenase (short-subunit alcohol dehydrogenase family)